MDRSYHGWSYSVFAGAVAGIIETVWISLAPLAPGAKLAEPASIAVILVVTLCAFVAARIASNLAARAQQSDHGVLAGCATWPIFSLLIGVAILIRDYFAPPPFNTPWPATWSGILATIVGGMLAIMLFSSLIALPACLLGTAVFNAGLRVFDASRRALSRPPPGSDAASG
jgi:hypothetical protein